jgi:hypothetical protein
MDLCPNRDAIPEFALRHRRKRQTLPVTPVNIRRWHLFYTATLDLNYVTKRYIFIAVVMQCQP